MPSQQKLTTEEKAALTIWRSKAEAVLAFGGAPKTELEFWLKPMGFQYSGGRLEMPWNANATYSSPWTYFEYYLTDWHWWYDGHHGWRYADEHGRTYINKSTQPDFSGLSELIDTYPLGTDAFTLLDALYTQLMNVLGQNYAALAAAIPGFSRIDIISGLMVLYEVFLVWGTSWWNGVYLDFYSAFSESGTIGPYTVTTDWCENGVVWAIDIETEYKVCHQSADADILIQDEAQTTLAAYINLSERILSELDADIAIQGPVKPELDADIAIQGPVYTNLPVSVALQDETQHELEADVWLSARQTYDLSADIRLASGRFPFDADICIQGRELLSLSASIVLEPDFESEELTRLERLHIQKFRIHADPRKYPVFDAETAIDDGEVVP